MDAVIQFFKNLFNHGQQAEETAGETINRVFQGVQDQFSYFEQLVSHLDTSDSALQDVISREKARISAARSQITTAEQNIADAISHSQAYQGLKNKLAEFKL